MPVSFANLFVTTASRPTRRLLWHVISVGKVSRDEPESHEGFDKPGAFLFFVNSGQGSVCVENRHLPVAADNRCWLLDLRRPRTYFPDPALVTEGLHFSGPGVESWLELMGDRLEFELTPEDGTALRRIFRRLLLLVKTQPANYEWQAHLLITDALGRLLANREILTSNRIPTPEPVAKVLDAVLRQPAKDWKARELATVAGTSYSKLRELFRGSQNETMHEFLQRTRLDQARLLLGDHRLSIKEVAERLHFSGEDYFSHFFRNAAGLSPSQFRRETRAC